MDWVSLTIHGGFVAFACLCVLVTIIGLPGTWTMLTAAVVIELCDTFWGGSVTWGWTALGVCLGLCVFGELLEILLDDKIAKLLEKQQIRNMVVS